MSVIHRAHICAGVLTIPKFFQSSSSLSLSVRFRWMIRWRRERQVKSNMNCKVKMCCNHYRFYQFINFVIASTDTTYWFGKSHVTQMWCRAIYLQHFWGKPSRTGKSESYSGPSCVHDVIVRYVIPYCIANVTFWTNSCTIAMRGDLLFISLHH